MFLGHLVDVDDEASHLPSLGGQELPAELERLSRLPPEDRLDLDGQVGDARWREVPGPLPELLSQLDRHAVEERVAAELSAHSQGYAAASVAHERGARNEPALCGWDRIATFAAHAVFLGREHEGS